MDLNMKDKVVVITGGSSGIGKAAALEFAREGAKVSICARTMAKLEAVQQEYKELGFDVDIYQVDVGEVDQLQAMADAVIAKHGRINIWINNAGIDIHRPVLEFTREHFDAMINTNLYSVFEGCRIAGRHMIERGEGGVIMNIASYTVKIPHSEGAIYAATKCGVSSFTKTFAASFAPYGIRVVGIIPGMIETEISREAIAINRDLYTANVAAGRLGQPEDLTKPMVFLASDCCDYINGCDIEIHGGKYAVQNTRYAWDRAAAEGK